MQQQADREPALCVSTVSLKGAVWNQEPDTFITANSGRKRLEEAGIGMAFVDGLQRPHSGGRYGRTSIVKGWIEVARKVPIRTLEGYLPKS